MKCEHCRKEIPLEDGFFTAVFSEEQLARKRETPVNKKIEFKFLTIDEIKEPTSEELDEMEFERVRGANWYFICVKCPSPKGVLYEIKVSDFLTRTIDCIAQLYEKNWFSPGRFMRFLCDFRGQAQSEERAFRKKINNTHSKK